MTDSAVAPHTRQRRPPALAIWSLALVVAPFLVATVGAIGGSLEVNADRTINYVAERLSIGSEYVIPVVWLASIVVGIVAVIAPLGRWRLVGILAIVAPEIEAIALLVLITFAFSTV